MANAIIMPKVGIAMEEGTIIQWMVKEGDTVKKGDIILEIETDKSSMEVESDFDGTLLKIIHGEGVTLPVTLPIAFLGEPGENIDDLVAEALGSSGSTEEAAPAAADAAAEESSSALAVQDNLSLSDATPSAPKADVVGNRVKATPAARRLAKEKGLNLADITPTGKSGEIRKDDVLAAETGSKASPLAWKMMEERGMVASEIAGSGHDGKVMKADVESAAARPRRIVGEAPQDTRVKLTQIQKITGKRMLQSHMEIPVVTENIRVDVTEMLDIRSRLNESLDEKISINDFVLAAVTKALQENPRINSVLDGDEVIYKGAIHLGIAVATPKGLVVPVLPNAQDLSLSGIAAHAKDLAVRGRDGALKPDELSGSTFTISNLGMFGIHSFTPIINQPEAAILGVCAIEDQLKLDDGQVVNRKVMGLSLSYDHRIVDGAEASIFLKCLRDYLEAPLTVLA